MTRLGGTQFMFGAKRFKAKLAEVGSIQMRADFKQCEADARSTVAEAAQWAG